MCCNFATKYNCSTATLSHYNIVYLYNCIVVVLIICNFATLQHFFYKKFCCYNYSSYICTQATTTSYVIDILDAPVTLPCCSAARLHGCKVARLYLNNRDMLQGYAVAALGWHNATTSQHGNKTKQTCCNIAAERNGSVTTEQQNIAATERCHNRTKLQHYSYIKLHLESLGKGRL